MASETVGRLLAKYSLPAIASSLVSSLYNIVDQIFVGYSIGELGNAATNVAFPLVMIVTTLAMGVQRGRGQLIQPLLRAEAGVQGPERGGVQPVPAAGGSGVHFPPAYADAV